MTADLHDRLRRINDPALRPLIEAADDDARECAIGALVTGLAGPIVEAVLRRSRRAEPDLRAEDTQEIASTVALRLVRKLRTAALFEEHAIAALDGYISTLTYNAVHDYRRRRHPERHRLKRNLRYVLTRDPGFALWEASEQTVAGLARWSGQAARAAGDLATTSAMRDPKHPAEALRAIFEQAGHPLRFEALVDLAAELWDVRDAAPEHAEVAADERPDQLSALEQRQYLAALWSEIRELPDKQRTALLLNLRDSAGSNALTLFLLLEVAGAGEIARAAGLDEEALNAIWNDLPLDDLTIAARLGLTRQQVINLRKSARLRLARRMAQRENMSRNPSSNRSGANR